MVFSYRQIMEAAALQEAFISANFQKWDNDRLTEELFNFASILLDAEKVMVRDRYVALAN